MYGTNPASGPVATGESGRASSTLSELLSSLPSYGPTTMAPAWMLYFVLKALRVAVSDGLKATTSKNPLAGTTVFAGKEKETASFSFQVLAGAPESNRATGLPVRF